MATWEEYLQNQIQNDGVQMTWNVLPHSRADSQKLIVPAATFFTPLKVLLLCSLYKIFKYIFNLRKDQQINQSSQHWNMIQSSAKNRHVKLF
jgi:hypothetical protein